MARLESIFRHFALERRGNMAAWKLSFEEEIKELLDVEDDVDLPRSEFESLTGRSIGGGRGGIRRSSDRTPELRTIPEFRKDSGRNASSTPAGVSGATAGGGRKPGRGLGRGQRIRARALKREQEEEVVFGGCGHLITSEIAQLAISETASTSSRDRKVVTHTHWVSWSWSPPSW